MKLTEIWLLEVPLINSDLPLNF